MNLFMHAHQGFIVFVFHNYFLLSNHFFLFFEVLHRSILFLNFIVQFLYGLPTEFSLYHLVVFLTVFWSALRLFFLYGSFVKIYNMLNLFLGVELIIFDEGFELFLFSR